ncbi:uncharacterized protein LOC132717508, partial [Ruditapes philippinarum]|uniref:uncharacterized protein LOC132717508 n=1 Tax=Ruditapes philippinarum TaxID=129788 RepID=UPI00295C25FB
MGSAVVVCVDLIVCCLFFPPLVLQTVEVFTAHWVSNSTCDSIGLMYRCCAGQDNETRESTNGELDACVLGFEMTSFVMMLAAEVLAIFGVWFECQDDEDEESRCAKLINGSCLLFACAGILSFAGCMMIMNNFPTSQLGWSFYLCLVNGCFVILILVLVLAY